MSDTHDNEKNTAKALNIFRKRNIKTILHAGDFISLKLLSQFEGFKLYLAIGNCDLYGQSSELFFVRNGQPKPRGEHILNIEGKKIFLTHGDSTLSIQRAIECEEYDYIIKGHTHFVENYKKNGTRILNPGAVSRADICSVGILHPYLDKWEIINL
ncbi:MAG: YfcE family phosphodiesterase [Spirochaetia bacterium]|nr:YfcE family phosphodiesterase [Spirochaetia bacterium]